VQFIIPGGDICNSRGPSPTVTRHAKGFRP
jgi:hypothetical protein